MKSRISRIALLCAISSVSFYSQGQVSQVSNGNNELSLQALRCGDFEQCKDLMLRAAIPRNPEASQIAAVRILEYNKVQTGNKKAARQLNSQGLAEYKKENFGAAIELFQQAAVFDPSDVEILANLGLVLLRANRQNDALQALNSALRLNPRRTNTWVPMAEYYIGVGNISKASAALLLAYEFSSSKENTILYYENKAKNDDQYASTYRKVTDKINEENGSSSTAKIIADNISAVNSRQVKEELVTKDEARIQIQNYISTSEKFKNDPAKKEIAFCMATEALNQAFPAGTNTITKANLSSRFTNTFNTENNEIALIFLKCTVNSKSFEQIVKSKNGPSENLNSKAQNQIPLLALDDFRLDFSALNGRKIRINATGNYMMNMFILKKGPLDMNPVIVDITKIPREQQRYILQNCTDIMDGCKITVQGTVAKVNYQNGIVAEMIEW